MQLSKVSTRYGAPMGRACFGTPAHAENKIRVFRVALDSGGYDNGGAYWGHGAPLWCATDGADYVQFARANSRFSALVEFEIERHELRYHNASEFKRWAALAQHNAQGREILEKLRELGY